MEQQLVHDSSYVNGEWYSKYSLTFEVVDPANCNVLAQISDGGAEVVEKAIDAAAIAFITWCKTTAKERSELLERWYNLILEHQDNLVEIMTLECGKPLEASKGEVSYGATYIKWFAEEEKRAYGDIIPSPFGDRRVLTIKQHIGVVGTINPYNFSLAMITRKVAPALAAGCTFVLMPSEETPLNALALAKLSEEAGFPKGVFNVVVGKDAEAMGKVLCADERVRKISFTRSTHVGQLLMSQSASTLKKLSLELGGNAPFIVFEDADIDSAVQGAKVAKFRNAGQTCVCVNRFLIHEKVYDEFVMKFEELVARLSLGNGMKDLVQIGPFINRFAMEKNQIICGGWAE